MTPEVKKRIEQIRQGIVPEGYVKDKDGIYPRDWASKKIGQWLKLAERSIVLQDEEEYQLVTVRRGFGGVDSRGSFLGKNVLVKNYFIVKTGDFIISKRQIAHGACGIVPPELDGAVVSNEYNVFLPQDGTNIQMFNLMMQLPHYKRLFYLMSDGVHIEKLLFKTQDWMKRTLAMPLLKEQKKIAEILATQDKAIELQARKIEELKRFKKGCLEKMFPRKGQKVPEKRFPGFTDDWEQRKFSELVQIERGGSPRPIDDFITDAPNGLNWVKIGDAPTQGNYITKTAEKIRPEGLSKTREVHPGDLILSNSMSFGKPYIMGIDGCIHDGWLLIRNIYGVFDLTFLCHLLGTPQMLSQYRSLAAGSTVNNLNKELVGNTVVTIPSITEQRVLGDYLEQLDNLITLHQRKLEEMKKQKKALMQLLLTGIVRVQGNRFCCDF